MALSDLVVQGYGGWSSINKVPTLGFSVGAEVTYQSGLAQWRAAGEPAAWRAARNQISWTGSNDLARWRASS